jgi:hypothetical protein
MTRQLKAKHGRPTHSGFRDLVQALPVADKMLGLTHITSSYLLRDIVQAGQIEADEPCRIIGEPVSYAFYGRAAFRAKGDFEPSDLTALFPTVLVLDPYKVPPPKYVFAFDSGAFMEGLMDQYLHPYMPLFDFLLQPEPMAAARLIKAVFPSPDHYFYNQPKISFDVPSSNFEAESYTKLLMSGGRGEPRLDDRASTPELLFADPISLKDCVVAAVVPHTLSEDPEIGGRLSAHGVQVLDYPFTGSSRPGESHLLVRSLVQAVYKQRGWL